MDEALNGQAVRTGEMSEVGAQLFWLIEREFGWITQSAIERIVDLVETRFEVTAKPVVTDQALGQMVAKVHGENSFYYVDTATKVGERLRKQLEQAGLRIVRAEDGER